MVKLRNDDEVQLDMPRTSSGLIRIVVLGLGIVAAMMFIALKPAIWVYVVPIGIVYLLIAFVMECFLRHRVAREAYYASLSEEQKATFRELEALCHTLNM